MSMKRFFLTFLVSVSIIQVVFPYENKVSDEDKEYVKIDKEKENGEFERSVLMVECYIDRVANIIELEYSGIGIPVVYVCNFYGNVSDCKYGTTDFGAIVMNLPSVRGMYRIIVESNIYRGIGTFAIN